MKNVARLTGRRFVVWRSIIVFLSTIFQTSLHESSGGMQSYLVDGRVQIAHWPGSIIHREQYRYRRGEEKSSHKAPSPAKIPLFTIP
jgi:hypothetical protein